VTRIVPEVTHNLERRAAAINLGREIASLQTDNIPAGAEHVLLRCSDAQTTTNIFFLRALSVENGNESKITQVTPIFKQSTKRRMKVMEVHLHVFEISDPR
jgi:hypothetical protein